MKKVAKTAFKDTIPVLTGYLVLGFGFGIVLKANGYGILLAFVMSLFIYAGSMQYVAINLFTGGAGLITVALTTLMVNARHLFYGISMLEKYKDTGKRKPYLIFALTDETYSLVCNDNPDVPTEKRKDYYWFVSLFNQIYWILGSVEEQVALKKCLALAKIAVQADKRRNLSLEDVRKATSESIRHPMPGSGLKENQAAYNSERSNQVSSDTQDTNE